MQPSAIFPIISLVFLVIACSCAIINQTCLPLEKMIMIAGANFVISGLSLLTGIVLYVGSVSQSFDSSSNSINTESKYLYSYDISFHLTVISFVLMKFSGVVSLYHYIAISKHNIRVQMTLSQMNINKFHNSQNPSFQSNGGSIAKTESCDFSDRKPILSSNGTSTNGQLTQSPIFKINKSVPHFLSASDHTLTKIVTYKNSDFDARIYEDNWGAYDNFLLTAVTDYTCQRKNHLNGAINSNQISNKRPVMKCSNSLYSLSLNDVDMKTEFLCNHHQPVKRKITLV